MRGYLGRRLAFRVAVSAAMTTAAPAVVHAQSTEAVSTTHQASRTSVRATLDSFIVNFNNLDSARFGAQWAPSASAILPFADTPQRLDGRDAILARFMRYFAQVRTERTGPPYLHMVVRNIRIDLPADGIALVAYEFDAAGTVRNRALVMSRAHDGGWRIVQMVGS